MLPRLLASNTALFVCDVQSCFLKSVYAVEELINTTSFLLKSSRVLNLPCVITEQYPEKLKHTVDALQPLISATETQKAYPVFPKVDFTMMSPAVKDYLHSTCPDVKNVLICGMETHVCVLQTCYDLLENGYNVYLCVDAVSSRSPVDRKVAIQQLQKDGVVLTTAENAMFQIIRSKNNAHFKEISSLVKSKELPKLLDF